MTITIDAYVRNTEDRHAFNQLNIWCAKNSLRINSVFDGNSVRITISGDDIMLADLLAYLTEKKYADI